MNAEQYMRRALELAQLGINTSFPNPRVGCVIVADNAIVGEGYHQWAGQPHAEINALQDAGTKARGATAYITLEPCNHQGRTGPCSEALINAGIAKVVYAVDDPNPVVAGTGAKRLKDAGIEVEKGLLAIEAAELNRHFFHRMKTGKPWFCAKMAMSIDGRTALANRQSQWITGPSARNDVHQMRAQYQSIMTGIGTVRTDNPRLTVRGVEAQRQPTRILIDAWLDAAMDAKIFNNDGDVIVLCAESANSERVKALTDKGVKVVNTIPINERNRLELDDVATELGRLEINSVWMECGSHLTTAFLQANLVDELMIYVGNTLIGMDGFPLIRSESPLTMNELPRFTLQDIRKFDDDIRLQYLPIANDN